MNQEFPEWLKKGSLYKIFSEDSDIPFILILKENETVNNEVDFVNYLKTADYWGINLVEDISESAKKYILDNIKTSYEVLMDLHRLKNVKIFLDDFQKKTSIDFSFEIVQRRRNSGRNFLERNEEISLSIFCNEELVLKKNICPDLRWEDDEEENPEIIFKDIDDRIESGNQIETIDDFTHIDEDNDETQKIYIYYKVNKLVFEVYVDTANSFCISSTFSIPINQYNKKKLVDEIRKIKNWHKEIHEKYKKVSKFTKDYWYT